MLHSKLIHFVKNIYQNVHTVYLSTDVTRRRKPYTHTHETPSVSDVHNIYTINIIRINTRIKYIIVRCRKATLKFSDLLSFTLLIL